jgi:phosphoserine phosphatase
MPSIRFLSTDLNGTLVHPHTMQEMIRLGFPDEPHRFEAASHAFSLQTDGKLAMEETFRIAGKHTRGLPLRLAIDYALEHMPFVDGYEGLMEFVKARGIQLLINSTGYTVTHYAIRHGTGTPFFHIRCNRLLFAEKNGRVLGEEGLEALVRAYLQEPGGRGQSLYGEIRATGEVILGIQDEADKARLALELAASLDVPPHQVAHMGDTMGDSMGILKVARAGGLGIAFNYNRALEAFLRREGGHELEAGRCVMVDPKGPGACLERVLPFLEQ